MKTLGFAFLPAVMLVLLTMPGCQGSAGQEAGEAFVVPPDKADDFLSVAAQEYLIEGETTVTLEEEYRDKTEGARMRRVRKLIPLKQVVIGWFLNQYIGPKDTSDPNGGYGGFDCLTKNGSYEEMNIRRVGSGLGYRFKFRQEIGGTLDLLQRLPTRLREDGRRTFMLTIGKISNEEMAMLETNNEWYREAPWETFDPGKVDPSRLEEIELAIRPEPRSLDAWFDHNRLFADGSVTMAFHFGWDYHNQYHLVHSRMLYDWLTDQGFRSPVSRYENYTRRSGPLTKSIRANGRRVSVKAWLFWGQPGSETDPDTDEGGILLEEDLKESLRDREVIVFTGHSGPFYGFALANWKKTEEGDLDDAEIPELDMPADVYQVVFAEGCETYGLGQAFWENPAKADRQSLDILTTTSYSDAGGVGTVTDFVTALIGTDDEGNQQPQTFRELLRKLEDRSWWMNTMYGVHGLDDNPHLHPYADPDQFCRTCRYDRDCPAAGFKCARINDDEKACFGLCTADDGCPAGWKCMDVAYNSTRTWNACVPANLTCLEEPADQEIPRLMLNEVLADPPSDDSGDVNGDGERDSLQDEFVEIVNWGAVPVRLDGWSLSDGTCTRFTFPPGGVLAPGEAAVVFGGGQPRGRFGESLVFASDDILGLNNGGDAVSLVSPNDSLVDWLVYGPEADQDRSLVRAFDGDPNSEWIPHPDPGWSPGARQDGSAF